ncbi:DUF4019 domain-containing protein [Lysobacter cavernae]|uniref:DUF4019 domain-containing protein n=1 Tax=Lysobacter cavernae TaxID=1685901 RepID=A0ABV7RRA6_9GAMM
MNELAKFFVGLLMLAAAASAMAQQPKAQPQPQTDLDPTQLVGAGLRVAQMIDAGKSGEVWDGASAVAKRSVQRKQFDDGNRALRKPLGSVVGRRWAMVNRHVTPGSSQLPAGVYANVQFETSFASRKVGNELVSFRLDEDGTWRLSGYVLK